MSAIETITLPKGVMAGYTLMPGVRLPDGWQVLIKDTWWGWGDGGAHPIDGGYMYPQTCRPEPETCSICGFPMGGSHQPANPYPGKGPGA